MPTLTYDFEGDATGSEPADWSYLCDTADSYLNDVYDLSGDNVWRSYVQKAGGGAIVYNDHDTASVADCILSGVFRREEATATAIYCLRSSGTCGTWNGYQMHIGNGIMLIYRFDAGAVGATIGSAAVTTTAGSEFNFKFECTGSTIRGKVWSGAEPGWDVSGTDGTYSSAGAVVVGGGGTASSNTVYHDDISIESDELVTDVEVTPTLGTLEVTGYDPVVKLNVDVDVSPVGALGIKLNLNHTVTVNKVTVVQAALGTLEAEGYDPVIIAPTSVTNSSVGTLEIEGFNPSITATTSTSVTLFVKFKDDAGNVHTRQFWVRPLVSEVTTTYTAQNIEEHILADATGGAFTITMPTAVAREGFVYTVKKTDSSANAVKVDGLVDETIDGDADFDLEFQDESITLVSDGSDWWII